MGKPGILQSDARGVRRHRIEPSALEAEQHHSEPEYKEVLDECTREFSEIAGIDIAKEYETSVATLFYRFAE